MTSAAMLKPDHTARRRYDLFTDEHEDLRASIRRFVATELTPHIDEWEATGFPDSVFARLGECGFLGLDKPEEYGGQGGDFLSELILCEELYYGANGGLAMGVGVQVDMAMPPILAFGTEEQKQQWAVPGIAGEKILCLGISEPGAGSDVAAITTRAVRDGGDWVINGTKTYITNGIRSDAIVLVTRTDPDAGYDGFTLFLVPMDTPGITRSKRLEKLGMHASDTALITFEDVRVPDSAVLGVAGKGFYQIMWELQGERLSGCAGNIAAAQRAFDITLEYARTRETFGKPIGRHQAVRHRLAEMAIKLEAARELTYATARRMVAGDYPVREVSMAKVFTCRVVNEVADECVQLHGGAGYMKEYGVERLWRDIRLCRIGGGTDEIMLDVIGKSFGL
ncbi:MAG: citronellyl-CoA dehydrogenase [Solirubrobacteraceae bacterium]|jgi:alkylation response protein AidB-like acyl-CoA dehydrogenase|nr:citronellyl-CoA dehydrogenase [Solirubrobacteraceae bacterium]